SNNHSGSITAWNVAIVTDDAAPTIVHIADQVVGEGQAVDVAVAATDADGDPIAFSGSGLASFVSLIDHHDGTAAMHIAPPSGTVGTFSFQTVRASDGDLTGLVQFKITVTDKTPPSTTATPSPSPNAAGWNRNNVTVHLAATDL